jgi:hypothetical protein
VVGAGDVAEQEGVRVGVDRIVLAGQQLAGAGDGDGDAGEGGCRGGGLDGAAGCGAGDAAAVSEVVVQGGDCAGDRACPYWTARARELSADISSAFCSGRL